MVGLTAYLEQVRTGVWDIPAGYLPADYFEGITMAGVLRYCCRRSRSTPRASAACWTACTLW
ncbi:glutamine amidotransferase [Mycobacterium tuberculosis variant bovis BCG]|nr:glutamine amidotransferase [Mycobacterium tuberculosis variant bovis BCG]